MNRFLRACGAMAIAMSPILAAAALESTAEMREAVVMLAGASLHAEVGGRNQAVERFILLNRLENGTTGVGGFGVITGKGLELPSGTVGVIRLRPGVRELPPHGNDDRMVKAGVLVFVVGDSGKIWEIANPDGVISIRSIDKKTVGAWEPFQKDAGKYRSYR